MSALDDLRKISRYSDDDKITRLENRVDELNDRVARIGEVAAKAIENCQQEVKELLNKVYVLQQSSGTTINNAENQQNQIGNNNEQR